MSPRLVKLMVMLSCWWQVALGGDQAANCPNPSKDVQATCRDVRYKDLPAAAKSLLKRMNCTVHSNSAYDYGIAIDLNRDGIPEYQFCCHEPGHGPCGAVLIGKVGSVWQNMTANLGLAGFENACSILIALESRHNGFHDVCLRDPCSPPEATPAPIIWQYEQGKYRMARPHRETTRRH